jgi:hypothetical protein
MKSFLLTCLLLLTICFGGCSSNKVVNEHSQSLAAALDAASNDVRADAEAYTRWYSELISMQINTAQDAALEVLAKNGNLTEENRAIVSKVFDGKRHELVKAMTRIRDAYGTRVQFLKSASQLTLAIDEYHRTKANAPWAVISGSTTSVLKTNAAQMTTLLQKMLQQPIQQR